MGTVRKEKLTMRAVIVALILLFSSRSLLVTRADSVSPQNSHFLRSLRSSSEDHFICALFAVLKICNEFCDDLLCNPIIPMTTMMNFHVACERLLISCGHFAHLKLTLEATS